MSDQGIRTRCPECFKSELYVYHECDPATDYEYETHEICQWWIECPACGWADTATDDEVAA